jgi:hypothetical protein
MKSKTLFRCLSAVSAAVLLGISAVCTAAADQNDTVFPGDSQPEQETYTSGDYTYSLLINAEDSAQKSVCIESYSGDDHNPVIPGELDGMPVIRLGEYAFVNMPTLETVTIPKSVLAFGNFTFAQCTNLREYIVEAGSEFCESRDGVLYTVDGAALLRYPIGTSPQEITVPDGIVGIGNVAFSGSRTLTRVTLPDTLEYIGVSAFSDCTSLNKVVIPSGVTEIPAYCFNLCSLLDDITLPDTVTSIGAASFTGTALSEFTVPASCTSIGQQAFANTKLKQITIPATVTTIGYSAFGWKLNAYDELIMDDTFVIRGYAGSTAETYATDAENENNFVFVDLTEQTGTAAPVPDPEPEKFGTGRIVGIVVCSAALVGIIVFALVSGRRKKPGADTAAPEKEEETGDEE